MRYELTDYEWMAIKPMLPNKSRGVRRVNDRRVLNGIFWVLGSGAPWRDRDDGDLQKLHEKLVKKKPPAPSVRRRTSAKRRVSNEPPQWLGTPLVRQEHFTKPAIFLSTLLANRNGMEHVRPSLHRSVPQRSVDAFRWPRV
jgi:hypothetical protein